MQKIIFSSLVVGMCHISDPKKLGIGTHARGSFGKSRSAARIERILTSALSEAASVQFSGLIVSARW